MIAHRTRGKWHKRDRCVSFTSRCTLDGDGMGTCFMIRMVQCRGGRKILIRTLPLHRDNVLRAPVGDDQVADANGDNRKAVRIIGDDGGHSVRPLEGVGGEDDRAGHNHVFFYSRLDFLEIRGVEGRIRGTIDLNVVNLPYKGALARNILPFILHRDSIVGFWVSRATGVGHAIRTIEGDCDVREGAGGIFPRFRGTGRIGSGDAHVVEGLGVKIHKRVFRGCGDIAAYQVAHILFLGDTELVERDGCAGVGELGSGLHGVDGDFGESEVNKHGEPGLEAGEFSLHGGKASGQAVKHGEQVADVDGILRSCGSGRRILDVELAGHGDSTAGEVMRTRKIIAVHFRVAIQQRIDLACSRISG